MPWEGIGLQRWKKVGKEPVDPLWVTARGATRHASIRQQLPWECEEWKACYGNECDKKVSQTVEGELR